MRTIIWASLAITMTLLSACATSESSQVLPASDAVQPTATVSARTAAASPPSEAALLPPEAPPPGAEREFSTDFSRNVVITPIKEYAPTTFAAGDRHQLPIPPVCLSALIC